MKSRDILAQTPDASVVMIVYRKRKGAHVEIAHDTRDLDDDRKAEWLLWMYHDLYEAIALGMEDGPPR